MLIEPTVQTDRKQKPSEQTIIILNIYGGNQRSINRNSNTHTHTHTYVTHAKCMPEIEIHTRVGSNSHKPNRATENSLQAR